MATPTAVNMAHRPSSNDASMLGVLGTLGTADTSGTQLTLPVGVDPLTGAQYVSIMGTTANGTSQVFIGGGTVAVKFHMLS